MSLNTPTSKTIFFKGLKRKTKKKCMQMYYSSVGLDKVLILNDAHGFNHIFIYYII